MLGKSKKDILYTTAYDSEGNLFFAKDAQKDRVYICCHCKGDMILRKKENGKKRPHFAHKALSENCTPESALHEIFKRLLYIKIIKAISNQESINIEWKCNHCGEVHSGNLIKKATQVKLETSLGKFRPDIILYDDSQTPFAAIEIVVTHKPEEELISFYKENNITLLEFYLTRDQDLDMLSNETLTLNCDICTNPKCKKCGCYMDKKYLQLTPAVCWKCKRPMNVALMKVGFTYYGPESFNFKDIQLSTKKGVLIKKISSKTLGGEQYFANICSSCNSFIGQNFMYRYLGSDKDKEFVGYVCYSCEVEN